MCSIISIFKKQFRLCTIHGRDRVKAEVGIRFIESIECSAKVVEKEGCERKRFTVYAGSDIDESELKGGGRYSGRRRSTIESRYRSGTNSRLDSMPACQGWLA